MAIAVQPKAELSQQAHIELNLIKRGFSDLSIWGNEIWVGAKRLAIFGGHPASDLDASSNVEVHTVTLPLTWFLQFWLPEEFMRPILAGQGVGRAGSGIAG